MKKHSMILINADTDSITICKSDMSPFSEDEQKALLEELNSILPEKINFAHDGYFQSFIVLKAKNYIMKTESGKLKIKGSSLKSVKTEKILKQMINEIVQALADHNTSEIHNIYEKYIKKAIKVDNIDDWGKRVTITKSILNCKGYTEQDIIDKKVRRNETDIWDAVKGIRLQEGDRVKVYPAILGEKIIQKPVKKKKEIVGYKDEIVPVYGLKLIENYNNDIDTDQLLKRVWDTLNIFKKVIDINQFTNYTLVKNRKLLENL